MIIAVTHDNGQVYEHFGHANELKLYTVSEGCIQESVVMACEDYNGHAAMADLLKANDVSMLICGNIGQGAREALNANKILVYPGVVGDADAAVEAFLAGNLVYNPDTLCDHHHGDEEEGCGCGGSCGCHGSDGGCGCGGCGGEEVEVELPPIRDYEYENPDGTVVEVTGENFDDEVIGHGYVVILNFGAKWCGPCKELAPVYAKLCKEYTKVKFCHIDCDEQPEIANAVQISSIPTMLIVKGSAVIDELIGAYPEEELRKALDRAIALEM